jgi:hypothetical protein
VNCRSACRISWPSKRGHYPFDYAYDMAPSVYLNGQPLRDSSIVRTFERATAKLTAVNPITGTTDTLPRYLADPVELKLLHMVNGDPARTPTFTMFADPSYWFASYGGKCNPDCVQESATHAWNHGGVAPRSIRPFLAWWDRACGHGARTTRPGRITRILARQ